MSDCKGLSAVLLKKSGRMVILKKIALVLVNQAVMNVFSEILVS